MKRMKRLLLGIGCALLLAVSWLAALTAESDAQRQAKLIEQAAAYTQDEIYVRAIPLLEEAAGYDDKYTLEAEEALKDAYLNMMDQSGYARKYTNLLEKQMARKDAAPEIYAEAAEHYLEVGKESEAFAALRSGIEKTGSAELTELYEDTRYAFKLNRAAYQDATAICNGAIQVKLDGFWGLANSAGELVVPCEFDAIRYLQQRTGHCPAGWSRHRCGPERQSGGPAPWGRPPTSPTSQTTGWACALPTAGSWLTPTSIPAAVPYRIWGCSPTAPRPPRPAASGACWRRTGRPGCWSRSMTASFKTSWAAAMPRTRCSSGRAVPCSCWWTERRSARPMRMPGPSPTAGPP